MKATVLGASGFVGSALMRALSAAGIECWAPARGDNLVYERDLGSVFYCIGMTADFRTKPLETVDAHVGILREFLGRANFDKLIYLSSTRVYADVEVSNEETALRPRPSDPDHLYNLSKMMGESLTLSMAGKGRVARLSNVLGPGMGDVNFVGSLCAQARRERSLILRSGLDGEKDYIWIDDAVRALVAISTLGKASIYNIAGGTNVRNSDLVAMFESKDIGVTVAPNAPTIRFRPISIDRLVNDTGIRPVPVMPLLSQWLDEFLSAQHSSEQSNQQRINYERY